MKSPFTTPFWNGAMSNRGPASFGEDVGPLDPLPGEQPQMKPIPVPGLELFRRLRAFNLQDIAEFRDLLDIYILTGDEAGKDALTVKMQALFAKYPTEREIRQMLKEKLQPLPAETREWYRAGGDCICPVCGYPYRLHPGDPASAFDGVNPVLEVLCNGDRVKL